jgi:tetratricopeptide (TPR) repeat protein
MKSIRQAFGTVALLTIIFGLSSCGSNQETIPITTTSDKARDYYVKARVYQENLRTQQAIEYFRLALEEDANFALAHLGLGFSLFNTNITEGFESLNRAVALAGNVSEGERLWIEASHAGINNDTRSSKELLEKLVALHHGDVRAHNLLGNFYYGQQEYDRAVTELRKANEIDPDYPPAYNMMGYAYRFLGKYKSAEKAFKTYIKLIPDNPNPYDSYAELLMKIGEYEESIEMYQKALSID